MHDYAIELNYTHHFAHEDGEYHVLESAVYSSQLIEGLYKVVVGQSEHNFFFKIENALYFSLMKNILIFVPKNCYIYFNRHEIK